MSLPVSMLCDRVTTKIPEAQIFFIGFFVEDLLKTLSIKFKICELLVNIAKENKDKWIELKGQTYVLPEN